MRVSHIFLLSFILLFCFSNLFGGQERPRVREFGIKIGVLPPGPLNAITDVSGVKVGQLTLIKGESIRTGVTAICPHGGNIYQEKVPAAIYVGNGYGKLTGISQVNELGNIETPIILTNTLSVPVAAEALIEYTLAQPENEKVGSVNPIVGETNDGWLNDIRQRVITREDVIEALKKAASGPVEEGAVGAGTGTICFGYKGGIGTASRKLPEALGGYTIGVLVQTNHGGILQINGFQVGVRLGKYYLQNILTNDSPGSCMVIVATDAPLSSRNLKRLAKRALLGIVRTGGFYSNGSGDYAIAFSTASEVRIPHRSKTPFLNKKVLRNSQMSPLFLAAVEACEEAILNSLFKATSMTGYNGHHIEALPLDKIKDLMRQEEK
ncbi:MAG: aminopeptidase [Candidatus Aminicenantes bacterium 4484_214]|nr:MAG: aminopeptidase [Candidatus Aminicenantes bacterium 4484_214]